MDAMVKMTKFDLKLITDLDMYVRIKKVEKGMKGRICYISNRFSKVKNKYLKSYDPKQQSKDIIYLDANTLYGYAMS